MAPVVASSPWSERAGFAPSGSAHSPVPPQGEYLVLLHLGSNFKCVLNFMPFSLGASLPFQTKWEQGVVMQKHLES